MQSKLALRFKKHTQANEIRLISQAVLEFRTHTFRLQIDCTTQKSRQVNR